LIADRLLIVLIVCWKTADLYMVIPMSHLGRVAKWLTPSHCILVAHRQAAKAAFVWFQNLPRLQGKWKPPGKDSSTVKIRASQPLGDLHKYHKSGEMNSTKITVDTPKKIQAQLPNAHPPQPSPKPPDQPPTSNHHTTNSHLGCRSVPRSNIWYEASPVHAGTGGRTPGTWSSRHHRCILRRAWYVGNLLLKHEETTRMGKWLPFHGKHWRKWRYTWEKHLILGYSAPNSWTNPDGSLVSRLVFILHVEDCGGIC
jgi:hypothetical protein